MNCTPDNQFRKRPLRRGFRVFREPYLDQGLIGNIALVGGNLDTIKKCHPQTQGNQGRRQLEVWQKRARSDLLQST
jgi:hypothetical protein